MAILSPFDYGALFFQLVKRGVWHSRSTDKNQTSTCLSSIVLSTLDDQPHCTFEKDNRISYRFVRQDSNDDSSNNASISEMDSSLRVGDYVVRLFLLGWKILCMYSIKFLPVTNR